jgi:SAM-dependent methyltransferase
MGIHSKIFQRYGLSWKRVLDLGCGLGEHLAQCGRGSLGVDLHEENIEACKARGLSARRANFAEGVPADLKQGAFDVCLISHTLEHVPNPHSLLIDARQCLREEGVVVVAVPVINVSDLLFGWCFRPFKHHRAVARLQLDGYLWPTHINFFTPLSLELTCSRAGYRRLYLGLPNLPRPLDELARPFAPVIWYVGAKIAGWQYQDTSDMALARDGRILYPGDRP